MCICDVQGVGITGSMITDKRGVCFTFHYLKGPLKQTASKPKVNPSGPKINSVNMYFVYPAIYLCTKKGTLSRTCITKKSGNSNSNFYEASYLYLNDIEGNIRLTLIFIICCQRNAVIA